MSEVRFYHRRATNPTTGKIDNRGGATFAYREEVVNGVSQVLVATARCHQNDNFCRAIGRVKAAGRLNSQSLRQVFNMQIEQFENTVLKAL